MHVGFVLDMYTPHVSGVTNHVTLTRAALEALGHEVHIITFGANDAGGPGEDKVVRSHALAWGDTGWQLPMGLSKEAREVLDSVDVVHAHHPFVSGGIARKTGARTGAVVAFTNHTRYDLYSDVYAAYVPRPVRYAYLKHMLSNLYTTSDIVVAPSEGIRQWMSRFSDFEGAHLVHNGIKTADFDRSEREQTRKQLGLHDDEIALAYVGRTSEEKDFDKLVDSFVRAAQSNPKLVFVVAGDGPSLAKAKATLTGLHLLDRTRLLGSVGYDVVPRVLAACDVFVTASTSETFPLTLLEAAAAGLPMIGVRSPGVAEIIKNGRTGIILDSAAGLNGAICQLTADSRALEAMGREALEDSQNYDISIVAKELADLYEATLAERKGTARL